MDEAKRYLVVDIETTASIEKDFNRSHHGFYIGMGGTQIPHYVRNTIFENSLCLEFEIDGEKRRDWFHILDLVEEKPKKLPFWKKLCKSWRRFMPLRYTQTA